MTSLHANRLAGRNGTALQPRLLSAFIISALAPGASMAAAAALPASPASPVVSAPAEFQTDFLSTGTNVDLSRFTKGNVVLPDTYRVDVVVNQSWLGREDVAFKAIDGEASAQPCFSQATLAKWGIDLAKVARGDGTRTNEQVQAHTITASELCGNLGKYIPDASVNFDSSTQSLTITVPQIFMDNHARGYVDPSQWDKGINAGILAYNFSSSHTSGRFSGTQSYLGVNAGINLGVWHLRHQGSLTWSSNGPHNYQNIATYAQRDIPALKAQVVLGDSFTSGQVADSFRVRGVNLYSDPRMYPQSQQGYAPTVRGVADSNARVTIRQNGYIIYETTVSPGPFAINDLFPTGYGGDLEVTVTETDGRKNIFLVPYTSVPQLLRPGITQFSLTAGQLEQTGTRGSTPWVAQATWQHGFNNTITGFTSATATEGYEQVGVGTAVNTRIGAVALNLNASNTQFPGVRSQNGQSVGVTFSKNLTQSGTDFSLGAYRYSTSGYLSLNDAVNLRDLVRRGENISQYTRQRSRLNLNISQRIGSKSQLFFNGSSTDYWSGAGRQTTYSLGYSSSFKSVSWSITAQRSRVEDYNAAYRSPLQEQAQAEDDVFFGPGHTLPGTTDNRIMLTFSIPLGTSENAPNMFTYLSRDTGSTPNKGVQVGVNGTAGTNHNISYGVSGNRTIASNDAGDSSYYNANIGYQGSYANVRGGYSRSGGSNQVSVSADGGIVIHSGGVQFSQQMGDTIGLVDAKDAGGALVTSAVGVHVGSNGYAIVPSLIPYQVNTVGIDPQGASDDVAIKDTTVTVTPRLGSVVRLKYETDNSRAVIIKARRSTGEPLPFAADVLDEKGNSVGSVGQASKLFVRGIADSGSLTVKWGDAASEQCRIDYQLPAQGKGSQKTASVLDGTCVSTQASQPVSQPVQTTPVQTTPVQDGGSRAANSTMQDIPQNKPTTLRSVGSPTNWTNISRLNDQFAQAGAQRYPGQYGSVALPSA